LDRRLLWPSRVGTVVLVVVAVVALPRSVALARSKPGPRIVAASMLDADGDFRADHVRLTYSQAVRHVADRDGVYPFSVVGYHVRSVGAAKGRVLLLALFERSAPDPRARPTIRYRQTRSKPVTGASGKQAGAQAFRATRAHGHTPPAPVPATTTVGASTQTTTAITNVDRDNDGTPDAQDCAPLDGSIHPGAPDPPDLGFVDSNCDGIDGETAKAVFASPLGSDTNPGTQAKPKRTIGAAVVDARGTGRYVLAAAGAYPSVLVATGVGIFGGYDPRTWRRRMDATTEITGSPQGVFADGATGVTLQLLRIVGSANYQLNAYGVRAVNGASLALESVAVVAGPGLTGFSGANGKPGANGGRGGDGYPGTGRGDGGCVSFYSDRGTGGVGGDSTVGRVGGDGGHGGPQGSNDGQAGAPGHFGIPGGRAGAGGNPGSSGLDGTSAVTPGASGQIGDGGTNTASLAGAAWQGSNGGFGRLGDAGNGGGGGGGSGGRGGILVFDMAGHGGGGGGGGGAPGGPGDGGRFGGGSFGIYLFNSTLTADSSTITSGDGGTGGRGGNGGAGGKGGAGGIGIRADSYYCSEYVGQSGDGGHGSDGGVGGAGGGGAGGPSVGVMKIGSSATLNGTIVKFGSPGPGGPPGTGGLATAKPSQAGIAQAVYP
jgi:hypothetical protein